MSDLNDDENSAYWVVRTVDYFEECSECRSVMCPMCDLFLGEKSEWIQMENELSGRVVICQWYDRLNDDDVLNLLPLPTVKKNVDLLRAHECSKIYEFCCEYDRLNESCGCGGYRICERCLVQEQPVFK